MPKQTNSSTVPASQREKDRMPGRPVLAAGQPGAAATEPPFTNRGVTVCIHWLSITFFTNPAKAMVHFLNNFLDFEIEDEMEWSEEFFSLERGARGYKALFAGPGSTRLYAYPETGKHCHFEIPGDLLDRIGSERTLEYLRELDASEFEWRASRVDIAFDGVPFTPLMCREARDSRRVRSRMHRKSWKWFENIEGSTFSIGSRQSGRFIRIYDRRGPTRLEIEFKDKWAKGVADLLAKAEPHEWIPDCVGLVRDYIDFLAEPYQPGQKTELRLADWWQEFVSGTERYRMPIPQDAGVVSRHKTLRLFERWLPSLYIIKHGLEMNLDEAVDKGKWRITEKHERQIRTLRDG